ncbi:hypothetical protein [Clostridium perfringens]|nr:hypothetical protein [Clostridium perfringens]
MRRKTHEEFIQEVRDKYEDEYIILSKYIDSKTKIKVRHNCKECNYHEWEITPSNILIGYGCPECGKVKIGERLKKTHEQFLEQLNKVHGEGVYIPLEKYVNNSTKILVRHNCKKCGYHEWGIKPSDLLRNHGCPVCSSREAKLGINTIWDTDRWMVDLGVSVEDAKRYTSRSNKKITVKCPDCGREKKMMINDIYKRKSISCSCGDGKSYPEKFVMNLLEQLGLGFEIEYSPDWIDNKRYDFYVSKSNMIIEAHGCQHYNGSFKRIKSTKRKNRTLQEEQINDKFKKETALKNGIKHYIELDCRESNVEWIKNSILNSELNKLFDLSKISWNKCAEFANKNIIKEVCKYWSNKRYDETTGDVGRKFDLTPQAINKYLKRGNKLGWCEYEPKEELRKSVSKKGKNSKMVEIFKDNKSLGVFESCSELERQSEKLFGVKLFQSNIGHVCLGRRKSHKGFTFKYVEEDNNLNINKIT